MPTNHISNSLAALLAVFYGHHAEENSSKVSHLFPGGNGDTPFDTGVFRTGHGGGSEVAGSRHFECSPSVVFSAGGEQGDFV